MDDYKRLFYVHRMGLKVLSSGNLFTIHAYYFRFCYRTLMWVIFPNEKPLEIDWSAIHLSGTSKHYRYINTFRPI